MLKTADDTEFQVLFRKQGNRKAARCLLFNGQYKCLNTLIHKAFCK